jgi:hypothetical protein
MARSRWTLAGQGAGEGFAAGFNYGMKPNIDRKNSLADLKAKVDQLGQYDPKQLNELQLTAFGIKPQDKSDDYTFPEFQSLSPEDQDLYIRFSNGDKIFSPESYANANILNWLAGTLGAGSPKPKTPKPNSSAPTDVTANFGSYTTADGKIKYPTSQEQVDRLVNAGAKRSQ